MKILYALQATDNGNIHRANELLPLLETMARVDILLSGPQGEVQLNHSIKFRPGGLSFDFAKKGSIDLIKTLSLLKSKRFLHEVNAIPVEEYDFIINDFEPVSAWACKNKNVPCIAMSHHYAILSKASPKPVKFNPMAWLVLRYYAPCSMGIGFHFKEYDIATLTPLIRSEIRSAFIRNMGHYTVYLPHLRDKKIIKSLSRYKDTQWQIFSMHTKESYAEGNCWIRPVNDYEFISSASRSAGVLCVADFEITAEALFMNKKLLVIPVKNQYEHHFNAAALKEMGVPVLKKLFVNEHDKIANWLSGNERVMVNYPDKTMQTIKSIFSVVSVIKENSPEFPLSLPASKAKTAPADFE